MAEKKTVRAPLTKMDLAVAETLKKEGFLIHVEVKGRAPRKIMEMDINPRRPIVGVRFLSTPSRTLYSGRQNLKKVKGGYGKLILSTSSGIMSAEEARKNKVGGKLLFEVW